MTTATCWGFVRRLAVLLALVLAWLLAAVARPVQADGTQFTVDRSHDTSASACLDVRLAFASHRLPTSPTPSAPLPESPLRGRLPPCSGRHGPSSSESADSAPPQSGSSVSSAAPTHATGPSWIRGYWPHRQSCLPSRAAAVFGCSDPPDSWPPAALPPLPAPGHAAEESDRGPTRCIACAADNGHNWPGP